MKKLFVLFFVAVLLVVLMSNCMVPLYGTYDNNYYHSYGFAPRYDYGRVYNDYSDYYYYNDRRDYPRRNYIDDHQYNPYRRR